MQESKKTIFTLMNHLVGKGLKRKEAYTKAVEFVQSGCALLIQAFVKKYNKVVRRVVNTSADFFASKKFNKNGTVNYLFLDAAKEIASKVSDKIKSPIVSFSDFAVIRDKV